MRRHSSKACELGKELIRLHNAQATLPQKPNEHSAAWNEPIGERTIINFRDATGRAARLQDRKVATASSFNAVKRSLGTKAKRGIHTFPRLSANLTMHNLGRRPGNRKATEHLRANRNHLMA